MPVKILNRRYINTLETSPNDSTSFLLGNVGEWLHLLLQCEFTIRIDFGISNSLTVQDPNVLKLNDGTSWGDWGFQVGDTIIFEYTIEDIATGNIATSYPGYIITALYGDTIELGYTVGGVPSNLGVYSQVVPGQTGEKKISKVAIYKNDPSFEGVRLDYAHIKNSQVQSGILNNVIDGTKLAFVAEDTESMTVGLRKQFEHYLTPYQSGLSVARVDLTYRGQQGYKQFYDIEVIFMISSFGDLLNFQNLIASDELAGANSITDQILITAYPVYNNPNVQVTNDLKRYIQEGNVGWFNENYNQLPNLFSASDVVYTNAAGTVVSNLDYANPITATTTISGVNVVAGQTRVQIGFIWNPIEEDYYNKTPYPFHECRKVNTGGNDTQGYFIVTNTPVVQSPFPAFRAGYTTTNVPIPINANDIQGQLIYDSQNAAMNYSDIIVAQNGTDIDVSVTFRPDSNFAAWMDSIGENERGYAIWVSVADQTPDANQSDRVALLLDVNVLTTYIEPIGEYAGMTIDFLDHPQDYTDTPNPCGNSIFVEDDLLAKVSFQEETDLTIPDTPELTKITFGFLVENTTTGQQYILDASDVDLTQYPNPTQYNFDTSRGFKLGTGNTKNWFKVDYDATNDSGTKRGVLGWYGYKVRWEDWIKRFPTPPNDFYDHTELQNGLNNDWFHYFNTSGWNFYFYVNLTAILNGQTVVYQNLKEITIKDYDSNADITASIKTYLDNNGTKGAQLIGGTDPISGLPLGVIIKNDYVWLEITYTSNIGAIADWASQIVLDANAYGINCLEVDKGAGQKEFRQLSSVWNPEYDNPLEAIPTSGGVLATLTYVSSTEVKVEARINGNKIIDAPRYKLSGRIGCK
jgi:hypothetical protein